MKPEDIERIKDLLPTSLGSAEIRERYAREILQRSVLTARMENMRYLAKIRDVCAEISSGRMNAAKAKEQLLGVLSQIGYDTTADDGKLANPVSERRLNLILETQREMAANAALIASQNAGTVDGCERPLPGSRSGQGPLRMVGVVVIPSDRRAPHR